MAIGIIPRNKSLIHDFLWERRLAANGKPSMGLSESSFSYIVKPIPGLTLVPLDQGFICSGIPNTVEVWVEFDLFPV
jgi:hypothetical protein